MRREILLETVKGIGVVSGDTGLIGNAEYRIEVYQTFIDDVPGLQRLHLELSPMPPFLCEMLVLSLEDGRKLKFATLRRGFVKSSGHFYC